MGNQVYKDMKKMYWRSGMKKDVAKLAAKYLTRQQVKFAYQWRGGHLQPMEVPI